MRFPLLLGILLIGLSALVIYQNPTQYTISFKYFEITATAGVMCASTLGLGVLTGFLAMMTRDVPRIVRLRSAKVEE